MSVVPLPVDDDEPEPGPPATLGVDSRPTIRHPQLGAPVAVYEYARLSGDVAFVVARFEPKEFRPAQLKDGRWRWNLEGSPTLLYRLGDVERALTDGETIWLVDGEKDCDALAAAGVCATCSARAQGFTLEHAEQLTGARRIRIVADADGGTGERQARDAAAMLVDAGAIASSDVELVQAAAGKDASDHFAAGHGLEDFQPIAAGDVDASTDSTASAAELVFTPIEEFAAVDEPGAVPLVRATVGGTVIPAGGFVFVYGTGGAGKTTLVIDLCFALASGSPWIGILEPDRPLRIAIVENDGPRPELRAKLRRKLAQHGGSLDGRIVVLEEPWARFTFGDIAQRHALAVKLTENETDLLVVGPLSRVGMEGGGTLDDIGKFLLFLREVRELVARPFAILIVHHENRAGQTSGAWENDPDTLIHVTGQGHGRTRVYWQKVRWSSELHATSTNLIWDDGESFTVEAKPEVTEDTIAESLLAAVGEHAGDSWTKIRDLNDADGKKIIAGNATEKAKVRDRLLAQGLIVNSAAREGQYNLWRADDPAAPRSLPGTAPERHEIPPPAGTRRPDPFPVPVLIGNGGTGTGLAEPEADPPENDLEWT